MLKQLYKWVGIATVIYIVVMFLEMISDNLLGNANYYSVILPWALLLGFIDSLLTILVLIGYLSLAINVKSKFLKIISIVNIVLEVIGFVFFVLFTLHINATNSLVAPVLAISGLGFVAMGIALVEIKKIHNLRIIKLLGFVYILTGIVECSLILSGFFPIFALIIRILETTLFFKLAKQ